MGGGLTTPWAWCRGPLRTGQESRERELGAASDIRPQSRCGSPREEVLAPFVPGAAAGAAGIGVSVLTRLLTRLLSPQVSGSLCFPGSDTDTVPSVGCVEMLAWQLSDTRCRPSPCVISSTLGWRTVRGTGRWTALSRRTPLAVALHGGLSPSPPSPRFPSFCFLIKMKQSDPSNSGPASGVPSPQACTLLAPLALGLRTVRCSSGASAAGGTALWPACPSCRP